MSSAACVPSRSVSTSRSRAPTSNRSEACDRPTASTSFSMATAAANRHVVSPGRWVRHLTRISSGTYRRRSGSDCSNTCVFRPQCAGAIAPYPFQNAMTRDVRTAGAAQHRPEYFSLWAGQAASLARAETATDIIARLMNEARAALRDTRSRLEASLTE